MGLRRKTVTKTKRRQVIEALRESRPDQVAIKEGLSVSEVYKIRRAHKKEQLQLADQSSTKPEDRHQKDLRILVKQWQVQIDLAFFLHNFVFCLPVAVPVCEPDFATPEGLLALLRLMNLRETRGDPRGMMDAFYRQVRERHQPSETVDFALPVEADPLMPLLYEHLRDQPLIEKYRLWKEKWGASLWKFHQWSGFTFGYALHRILLRGVEGGETWDSLVGRLYSDTRLRQEMASLVEPTSRLMACHLLAIALSQMGGDPCWQPLTRTIEVERAKAETRLGVIRSSYKIEPEVAFSELYGLSLGQPVSPILAGVYPYLVEPVPDILKKLAEPERLFSPLEQELSRLLDNERLPGKCPQCSDAAPRLTSLL